MDVQMKLNPQTGVWELPDDFVRKYFSEHAVPNPDKAELEASVAALDKLANFQVMGAPLGKVAIGTGIAFVIDKVIVDRMIASIMADDSLTAEQQAEKAANYAMGIEAVAAIAIGKYGKKWLGPQTASAVSFVLMYEAFSGKIAEMLDKFWPKSTASAEQKRIAAEQKRAAAQQKPMHAGQWSPVGQPVFAQGPAVSADYYTQALGRN